MRHNHTSGTLILTVCLFVLNAISRPLVQETST